LSTYSASCADREHPAATPTGADGGTPRARNAGPAGALARRRPPEPPEAVPMRFDRLILENEPMEIESLKNCRENESLKKRILENESMKCRFTEFYANDPARGTEARIGQPASITTNCSVFVHPLAHRRIAAAGSKSQQSRDSVRLKRPARKTAMGRKPISVRRR
jgi:hypothetical protein